MLMIHFLFQIIQSSLQCVQDGKKYWDSGILFVASALVVISISNILNHLLSNLQPAALPPNLEKDIADMDSKTGGRWQVLDR